MASPNHNMNVQNLSVPYMPKLQYRTKSCDGINFPRSDSISPVSPVSTSFSSTTTSTAPTSPRSDHTSSPTSKHPMDKVGSSDATSSTSPHPSPTISETNSKKRGGSFFGFFSVKEPSQQAFDDYQRQMRKKAASKDGRASIVGLPGVSSAKLPPTVPKVNSRWDGIPQVLKEKEKPKQSPSFQSMDGQSRSIRTSGSQGSTSTTTSSTRSRGSSLNSKTRGLQHTRATNPTDLYGWETASGSSGSITRNDIKAHEEALKALSITSSSKPYFTVAQAPPLPSILPEEYPGKLEDAGRLLGPAGGLPIRSNSRPSPMPITSLSKKSLNVQSDPCVKSSLRATTVEIPDTDEIIITSNGLRLLGPPARARQKARDSPFLAGEADEVTMSDEDTSPDASSRLAVSHGSSSFGPLDASFKDINPNGWVGKGANRATVNPDGSACGYLGANTKSIGQAITTPWGDTSPKISDGSKERSRSQPTLDGGKLRKKSMMGFFSK